MEDYLLSAKAGLLNSRHLSTRKKTGTLSDIRAVHEGGIPVLTLLGSQNAIGGKPSFNFNFGIPTNATFIKPKPESTPTGFIKPESTPTGFIKPKPESTPTEFIKPESESKKTTLNKEALSELATKPEQSPPFLIPNDKQYQTLYGKYLRTRYPGSVGILEYDKLLENDLLFTAIFHVAIDIQKRIIDEHKKNSSQSDFLDLVKRFFTELTKELLKEGIKEGGKRFGIPEFIRNKVADKVKDSIPNSAPNTKEERIKVLNDILNALFADHKEWKVKLNHYSKYSDNIEFNKSKFEEEQEKEDIKRAIENQEKSALEHQTVQTAKLEVKLYEEAKKSPAKLQGRANAWASSQASKNKTLSEFKKAMKDNFTNQSKNNLSSYKAFIQQLKSKYNL